MVLLLMLAIFCLVNAIQEIFGAGRMGIFLLNLFAGAFALAVIKSRLSKTDKEGE